MPIEILTPADVRARWAENPLHRYPTAHKGRARLLPYARPQIVTETRVGTDAAYFILGDPFARLLEAGLRTVDRTVLSSPADLNLPDAAKRQFNAFNLDVASNAIEAAFSTSAPGPDDALIEVEGRWIDMQIHPTFAHDRSSALRHRQTYVDSFRAIARAKMIIATVTGTDQWYDRETGLYLNAMPSARMVDAWPDRFELHRLDADACADRLIRFCDLIARHGKPDARVLVAVSPMAQAVAHGPGDALVDQFLAKAIQRSACDAVVQTRDNLDYLPALDTAILSDYRFGYLDSSPQHASQGLANRVLANMLGAYEGQSDARTHLHALGHAEAQLLANDPAAALRAARPAMSDDSRQSVALELFYTRALARLDRQPEAIDLLLHRLESGRADPDGAMYDHLLDLAESHGSMGQIDRLLALSGPDDPQSEAVETSTLSDHAVAPDADPVAESPSDNGASPAPAAQGSDHSDLPPTRDPRDLRADIDAAATALKAEDNLDVIKLSIGLLESEDDLSFEEQERVFSYLVQAMMREGQHVHLLPVLLDRIARLPEPGPRWPALAVKLARSHADLDGLREIQRLRAKFPADIDLSEVDTRVAALSRTAEDA